MTLIHIIEPEQLKSLKKHQRYEFNCKQCGKLISRAYYPQKFKKQSRLLCAECSKIDTIMSIYGTRYFFMTKKFKEKSKKTNLEKIGVEYPGQCTACRQKAVATYAKKHGIKYNKNMNSPFSLKEIRNELPNIFNKKYGSDWYVQTDKFKEESKNTKSEKYGDPNYNNHDKATQTNINRYGVDNAMKVKKIHKKAENTTLKRHGYRSAFDVKSIREKNRIKYQYSDGSKFDSAWELALWIYAIDHNEEIIREPCSFKYYYNKKKHDYVPDFYYKGKYIEIKGNHFFKDGKMICPWDNVLNSLYEAKHKCGLKNNVEFWGKEEIKPYIDYVEDKYGIDYLPSFKVIKVPKDKYK